MKNVYQLFCNDCLKILINHVNIIFFLATILSKIDHKQVGGFIFILCVWKVIYSISCGLDSSLGFPYLSIKQQLCFRTQSD